MKHACVTGVLDLLRFGKPSSDSMINQNTLGIEQTCY